MPESKLVHGSAKAQEVIEVRGSDYNTVLPYSALGTGRQEHSRQGAGCGKNGGFARLENALRSHFAQSHDGGGPISTFAGKPKPRELHYDRTKKSRSLPFASLRCAVAAWSASGACVSADRRNEREAPIGLQSEEEQ